MSQEPELKCDSTGEWRARTGTHHQIDTARLRALDGTPCVDEEAPGTDPYNHTTPAQQPPSEKSRRRSLDDMRQLSEKIKKSPNWGRPQK
jgi:hypothetical protein